MRLQIGRRLQRCTACGKSGHGSAPLCTAQARAPGTHQSCTRSSGRRCPRRPPLRASCAQQSARPRGRPQTGVRRWHRTGRCCPRWRHPPWQTWCLWVGRGWGWGRDQGQHDQAGVGQAREGELHAQPGRRPTTWSAEPQCLWSNQPQSCHARGLGSPGGGTMVTSPPAMPLPT